MQLPDVALTQRSCELRFQSPASKAFKDRFVFPAMNIATVSVDDGTRQNNHSVD